MKAEVIWSFFYLKKTSILTILFLIIFQSFPYIGATIFNCIYPITYLYNLCTDEFVFKFNMQSILGKVENNSRWALFPNCNVRQKRKTIEMIRIATFQNYINGPICTIHLFKWSAKQNVSGWRWDIPHTEYVFRTSHWCRWRIFAIVRFVTDCDETENLSDIDDELLAWAENIETQNTCSTNYSQNVPSERPSVGRTEPSVAPTESQSRIGRIVTDDDIETIGIKRYV